MSSPSHVAGSTRQAILDAAAEAVLRDGMHGARMQAIADAAGVSLGVLAYHFGNREGLLNAGLEAALARAGTERGSARERAEAILDGSGASRVRAEALREAVFAPGIRAGLAAVAGTEDDPGDLVLLAVADGLRQRISTGILTPEQGRHLLDVATAVLDPVEASR